MDLIFDKKQKIFTLLLSIFIGCLVISTVVARKTIQIFNIPVNFGVLPYVFTFIITDIVTEIWGKTYARFMIISGFAGLLFSFIWTSLALVWPYPEFFVDQQAYEIVLGNTFLVMIAGIVAYLASQFYDVWIFSILKKRTKGKYLWLRSNVSTVPAQIIDTVIFVPIAFYGSGLTSTVFLGILTFKIAVAIVMQFVLYFIVWILRNKSFSWSNEFNLAID